MRLRPVLLTALPTAFVLGTLVLPLAAHATGIPYFGPIVAPKGSDVLTCAAGFGALADLVNNAIAFLITILILFIAPFMIAWAGFLYVVSPGNPSMRSKASGILLNTAVGIAVALAAWLIVNALLAALTVKDGTKGGVAAWTSVMFSTTANKCLISTAQLNKEFSQAEGQKIDASITGGGGFACPEGTTRSGGAGCQVCTEGPEGGCESVAPTGSGSTALTKFNGGDACDGSFVSQAATDAGYSLSTSQANALGCISGGLAGGSGKEDSCGSGGSVTNYSWDKANSQGKASTAAGAYQLLLYTHAECWDNPVCQQTSGATGSINCKQGFGSNGFTAGGNSTVLNQCLARAADNKCAAAAASCLVKKNPSMSDWASPADVACKSKYGI